jgi:hypothetical protein
MGARPTQWRLGDIVLDPIAEIRKELEAGKEIPLADIKPAHGGLLTYEGQQVVLYIKDTRQDRETLLRKKDARRFHISDCKTLNRIRQEGRYQRYVATTRKDGFFTVEARDPVTRLNEEMEAELGVCRDCLTHIDWKKYSDSQRATRDEIWDAFSLDDFFGEFATFFRDVPTYTDQTAPRGGYAAEWCKISERFRRQRNWQCEKCQVDLSDHRALLHCHHKNGVVSDNRPNNIAVLCIECHARQPGHGHMRPRPRDLSLLHELRRKQRPGTR